MFNTNNAIKKIIGTPKKRGGKNDLDFDGVINSKDCQPRNTMRQDNGDMWTVKFEGGVEVVVPANSQNEAISNARQKLSDDNRYDFEMRRLSGGRITAVYKSR